MPDLGIRKQVRSFIHKNYEHVFTAFNTVQSNHTWGDAKGVLDKSTKFQPLDSFAKIDTGDLHTSHSLKLALA